MSKDEQKRILFLENLRIDSILAQDAPLVDKDLAKPENSLLLELQSKVRGSIWEGGAKEERKRVS